MATSSKVKVQAEVLSQKLRQCTNYRDFLKTYLEVRSLRLADLARATGFGRGFPGDILSGKRRLTAKSYYPFEKALKLPLAGKKYFLSLVAMEEPDIFPNFSKEEAKRSLETLRHKAWDRSHRQVQENENSNFQQLLKDHDVISVFAAAGNPETGATREQISSRTRLPNLELSKTLQKLVDVGLLKRQDETYYPQDLHLFLKTSDRSELLASLFNKATDRARRRIGAAAAIDSDAELFFTSQFCVRESQMPQLKAALRETVLKFIDESLEAEGDRVVHLLTALHF